MITYSTTVRGLTSASYAYTVPTTSQYRGIVVGILSQDAVPSAVTYGGQALTLQITKLVGNSPDKFITLWFLVAPPTGSNNVVITGGTITDSFVKAYAGVDQINPVNTTGTLNDSGSSMTVSMTTTVNDCFGVAFAYSSYSGNNYVGSASCTLYGTGAPYDFGYSPNSFGVAGGTGMTVTGSPDNQYMIAIALAPAVLLPIVDTEDVTNIRLTTAVGNGSVIYDGDVVISERGFVISTNPTPTTSDTKFVLPGTVGALSGQMNNLTINEDYHIRAFATNVYGTGYGDDLTFSTLNITATDIVKDINAIEGATYAVSLNLTGTTGSVTVKLGTTGTSAVFTATGGVQTMQGEYSGKDGLIITHSPTFDGTVDDLLWLRVVGMGTIDWSSETFTGVLPISSEVFFKRVEADIFDSFVFYRYLDLLFKDFNGYVTVTLKEEKNDAVTSKTRTFAVGNTSDPASSFSKKRVSFLCKDQALIIGLSNASLNETFAIAKFVLSGHKRPRKTFSSGRIISVGS